LCYIPLPPVFDLLRNVTNKSIVLVVSQLTALMKDQVSSISKHGHSAAYLSDASLDAPTKDEIKKW